MNTVSNFKKIVVQYVTTTIIISMIVYHYNGTISRRVLNDGHRI